MRGLLALSSVLLSLVACDSDGVTPVCTDAKASCTGIAVAGDAQAAEDGDLVDGDHDDALTDDAIDENVDGPADVESDAEPADGT
jgi:hypothetical protein